VIELFTIVCNGLKINEIRDCIKTVEKMRDNISF
jgi:hypothetical protein